MPISRADETKQLIPGLHEIIGLNYDLVDNEHMPLYDIETSDRSFEEEVLMTGFGAAALKSEGDGVLYDSAQEAWTARYDHETIALAFAITEEAMEDNMYESILKRMSKALGNSMANTKQQKAAAPYNNAFGSFTTGDGVALISDSHTLINGGTLDNSSGAVDLSETALENIELLIGAFVDDRGLLVNAKPEKLIIPRALKFTAFKILKSDLSTTTENVVSSTGLPGTSSVVGVTNTNKINALKAGGYFPGGTHVNNFLTDTNAFYVRTNVPDGMKMFVRKPLQVKTEGDFDTGNTRTKARERYCMGATDPRGIAGASGST